MNLSRRRRLDAGRTRPRRLLGDTIRHVDDASSGADPYLLGFATSKPSEAVMSRANLKHSAPSLEEQARLRDGESASGVLDAAMEAWLKRWTPSYGLDWAKNVESLAHEVKSALIEGSYEAADGAVGSLRARVCLAKPAKPVGGTLAPPAASDVSVVGSWLLRTCVKTHASLDLAVRIPQGLVTAKDYLNGRYWAKRASYLSAAAGVLVRAGMSVTECDHLEGDGRKSVLVVRRRSKSKRDVAVRVLFDVSPATFASLVHKLGPRSNCVRCSDGSDSIPTPRYNDAVLRECGTATRHVRMLHSTMTEAAFLGDAIVAIKAWLRQTANSPRPDGVSGFLASMLVLHVYRTTAARSAVELVRAILTLIIEWQTPLELALVGDENDDVFAGELPLLDDYAGAFDVVFVDRGARVNLAARVSSQALDELKIDAKVALKAVRLDAPPGAFEAAFPRRARPVWSRYDVVVRVPLYPIAMSRTEEAWAALPDTAALGEPLVDALGRRTQRIVATALDSRALAVRTGLESSLDGNDDGLPLAFAERELGVDDPRRSAVILGVRLRNDDEVFKAALRGPRRDETEKSQDFREFWGEKARLRRFRDGAVVEAVVWDKHEDDDIDWKRAIPERAVRFALARHEPARCSDAARRALSDDNERRTLARAQYEGAASAACSTAVYANGEAMVLAATAALDKLSAALRDAGTKPLRVETVSPAAPSLRYTAPAVARSDLLLPSRARRNNGAMNGLVTALDAVVRFEESAKWIAFSENDVAARAATRALVTRTAKALLDAPSLAADLRFVGLCPGTDGEGEDVGLFATAPHLRVLYAGFAFRLVPYAPGRRKDDDDDSAPAAKKRRVNKDRPRSFRLSNLAREPLALRELAFVHHSLVRALAARHAAFAPTVRLVSRWLHAQLLSDHISHEALEVLVVAVFSSIDADDAHGCGHEPPASAVNGFLRTLRLLWSRDWDQRPLHVDLRRAAADDDARPPLASKVTEPPYAFPLIASYFDDERGEATSRFLRLDVAPELPVFRLVQAAARESERRLGASILAADPSTDDPGVVDAMIGRSGGAATKRSFDAWFTIRKDVVSRGTLRVDDPATARAARAAGPKACRVRETTFANINGPADPRTDAPRALIGADPVSVFVDDIRDAFGHLALVFYNSLEPTVVGLAWRPCRPTPFAAFRSAYSQPDETGDAVRLTPNFPEILHDCAKLGTHVVDQIMTRG